MKKSFEWYKKLNKPTWAPPAKLFGPVWTVLYILIAISYGYLGYQYFAKGMPFILVLPFLLNLIFNFAYTPIQFHYRKLRLATLDILLVLSTLVWALTAIYPFIHWVVWINIPYLVWVCFAAVLQIEITILNWDYRDTEAGPRYTTTMIKVGDKAPLDLGIEDMNGKPVSLKGLLGSWVVLYAYPKDGTPGCVKEACGIRDIYGEFKDLGVTVIGISADSASSHLKFSEKYNLPFPLWSDPKHELLTALGVWGKKKFMGKSYMGVSRTTFLINKNGVIAHIWENVNPLNHAEDVLNFVTKQVKTSSV
jgi:peroxiredoxin/tryptophan-rich sensory protein